MIARKFSRAADVFVHIENLHADKDKLTSAKLKLIVTLSTVEICEDDGRPAVICGNCKLNAIVNSDKSICMFIDNQLPSDVIKTEDTDIANSDEFQSLETKIEETLDISLQNDVSKLDLNCGNGHDHRRAETSGTNAIRSAIRTN